MSKVHHVSISRLHKLIERLKARVNEVSEEIKDHFDDVTLRSIPTPAMVERMNEKAAQGLEKIAEAERLSRVLADLRTVVASQNERLGINTRLAKQDVLNRLIGKLKGSIESVGSDMRLSEIYTDTKLSEYGTAVRVMEDAQLEIVKKKIAELQREVFGLSDEVAELNATRVDITLEDGIAELITG